MAVPTYVDGQVLAAADVNSWFMPLGAYKTSDLGRATTSPSADPDLSVSVAASAVYSVQCVLFFKGSLIDVQIQWHFAIPSGSAGGMYYASYFTSGSGQLSIEADQWGDNHTSVASTTSVVYPIQIDGTLATSTTAGTFALWWGGVSTTPTVTLTARSKLVLTRLG